ncbi:histone-fold-containing protein [Aspergillus floccosus]
MPRKSTSSTPGDADDTVSPQVQVQVPAQSHAQVVQATEQQLKARAEGGASIEDYLLPRSLTLRLAKSVLPPNTSIQKDAVLAIQKAATVFVSYLSSHANEATLKRTVAPADVFSAISELEFDAFRPRLEKELDAYTEIKAGKRRAKKPDGAGEGAGATENGTKDAEESVKDTARGAKRVKRAEDGDGVAGRPDDAEDGDGDETQEEPEAVDENETEVEEEDGEEEDEDEAEEPEEDDIDRVEDLDRDARARRPMDPDAAGDETESDEDDSGPGSQLRGDLGLG